MGKGSSKGHTPREAKDNLKSTQLLSVIDAISEGPIEGPVDGLKSVLLNSTPVLDSEGNTNISGVTVVFRAGEQEQTPPEGFESSGSETVLGTEVKYDTPITRTITSANIDRLRVTFGVQALVETTSKGDRNPSEVRLLVQIQRNGGWVTEKDITIKGKTTSQYLASVVVGNLPPRPFSIRMRRMTPDSTTDQLQNKTLWSSYTEIIDVKQCYPNTALVGVQVDSEQFGSQQVSRNYHLRGRILQVPSNYNPQTRQYSGIWDGTFKPAYSNNMAWCLWDMLTHPRYGMGKRLGAADVDKWALYVIGQNCDQSVPDGFGGTEPRITCNAWLTTQRKAWDVLSDFCSAMRCMPVWNGQTLTFVQDRPSDKVWTYNRSNVVMPDDGAPFRYSFSALKDRHNAVEVRRQLIQPMLQAQLVPPARQPDRLHHLLSQHLPAQERHQQRPVKHRKVLLLQSPQKARQLPVPLRRKRQKRMRQRHNNQQPLLHPQRPRRRQKLPPQHGVRRPQKRQRNHQKRMHHQVPVVQLPRQRRQEIPRRRQKRPRRTLSLLKQQRDRAPQLRQVQKQRLRRLPVLRQQVPGRPQPVPPPPENRQKAPHHPLQQPQRRLAKPLSKPLQQRGLLLQQKPLKQMQRLQQTMLLPLRRQPHRPLVQRRHRHHLRLLQKMRRPDKRQQRKVVPRQQQRKHQRRQAVRRLHLRAKLLLNPRQRVPKQRQNGQRILHPPWRLRMQVRRKRG